ncbi:ABC transporter ATP-binding protein [Kutzneria buriramensis]|uniref:ABC-type multidrug transport system fused ATPase/permease subunit n=1 Tax=Kutzneria buriramensis TaxID=1045776 RepID=A0A3E0GV78_9PSEU|nr:ABC transporter ATP-binding protein [Kutzneria buriramensis]REH27009.1 ABC-type multidrug transport system fused ATPase/permease subunit [Kutzneria buriramensis]
MPENTPAGPVITRLLRPYRVQLAMTGLVGLFSAVLSLAQPLLVGNVVGALTGTGLAGRSILVLVVVFLTDIVLRAIEMYLLGRTGAMLVLNTRRTAVDRLLRATMGAHLGRQRGDLFVSAVSDTDLLRGSLVMGLMNIAASLVMVVGGVGLMAFIDPLLTLVTIGCLSAAAVANLLVARQVRRAMAQNREATGRFGGALQRALVAIGTVKVSRAEERESARVIGHANEATKADMRAVRLEAAMAPLINLGIHGSFAVVFTVGAARIASGALNTGGFASYLLYLFYMLSPLISLFTSWSQVQLGVAAAHRVTGLLELPQEPVETIAGLPEPPAGAPALEFESVSFGYTANKPVLHDVSFTTSTRGLTALVGPSGTGKTTLFSLAAALWQPDRGRILLNGVDLRALPLDVVRGKIGYVEQDAPVMDGTIRENLLYANPGASEESLWRAVELANLTEWVDSLPDGLDTAVGESGAAISGGQRQRIAVARMLLLEPEVLLLDEATSQLDAEAELALRRSVYERSRSTTVIAIAHRLSTVVDADRIVVLDQGCVRAVGSHRSLMEQDELYKRLVTTQLLPELPGGQLTETIAGSST